MKIIVDIPKETYKRFIDDFTGTTDVLQAVRNGKPLPKNHGRIGDLDAVMSDINNNINEMTNIGIAIDGEYLWAKLNDAIYNAQTIIEADEENNG